MGALYPYGDGIRQLIAFGFGLLAITVACSGSDSPEPTYTPTTEDFEIAVQIEFSRLYPTGASSLARDALGRAAQYSDSVYIASQCVAGSEMSPKGFRAFIGDTLRARSLPVIASDVINTILDKGDARIEQGLPAAEETCDRAYFYPQSGTEARLASDLVAAVSLNKITGSARDAFRRALEHRPASWFTLADNDDRPFLLRWLTTDTSTLPSGIPEIDDFVNPFDFGP